MNCTACGETIPEGLTACTRCGAEAGRPAAGRTRRTELDDDDSPSARPAAFVPRAQQPAKPAFARPNPPPAAAPRRTELDEGAEPAAPQGFAPSRQQSAAMPASARKRTQLDEDEPVEAAPQKGGRGARTVGWMISFDYNDCGQEYVLREGRNMIGRSRDCDISLFYDPQVSTEHAVVVCRKGKVTMRDEMSTHGTLLNGEDTGAGEVTALNDGDVVRFGGCSFKVFLLDAAESKSIWPKVFGES